MQDGGERIETVRDAFGMTLAKVEISGSKGRPGNLQKKLHT